METIFISIWVLLGGLNLFIYHNEIMRIAEGDSDFIQPNTTKWFLGIKLLIFSPYYFVVGVVQLIMSQIIIRKAKRLLKRLEENNTKKIWITIN